MVLLSSLEQEAWVLRAAGFAIATGDDPSNLVESAPSSDSRDRPWICTGRRRTPLGFLDAVILSFQRRHRSSPAAVSADDSIPPLTDRLWWETSAGRSEWSSMKVSQRPPMQLARGREI